jgi:formylglycine-generating enzyme required for sulfatase activity
MRSGQLAIVVGSLGMVACASLANLTGGGQDAATDSPERDAGVRGDGGRTSHDASTADRPDARHMADAKVDAPPLADAAHARDTGADAAPPHCPSGRGAPMALVGGFCIDKTEVTNAEYATFLSAVAAPDGGGTGDAGANASPPECSWNTTFTPGWYWPGMGSHYPVGGADWCDAYAYCIWAGKRLCGQVGGGSVNLNADRTTAQIDEWFTVCSSDGGDLYPYGNVFGPKTCNGVENDAGAALAVGSLRQCQVADSGIVDMSGNQAEWESSCSGTSGAGDFCMVRGGSFFDGDDSDDAGIRPGELRCGDVGNQQPRNATYGDIGFRCCADVVP